jgi:type VI secretion system secreted protein Hcp
MKNSRQNSSMSSVRAATLALCLSTLLSFSANAATDCFLKIEGVVGASLDERHRDEIPLTGFSWEEKNNSVSTGPGGGSGKVAMDGFHFTMTASKASPVLMLMAANGRRVGQAVLSCRRAGAGQFDMLTWTLTDVSVTAFQTAWVSSNGNAEPVDQVALGFSRIAYEYKSQSATGAAQAPVKAEWDQTRNQGGIVSATPESTPPATVPTMKPLALPPKK